MITDKTVQYLMKISTPKTFKAQEYICYEGQPGSEMYIVLKGCVGIYVANHAGEQTEVSRVSAGDFFGEMAVFDNLPRSASCVALEDVVCVAVGKNKLEEFVAACPDLTLKILENMSGRIRKMDNLLCKTEGLARKGSPEVFAIPEEYSCSRSIPEPPHDRMFFEPITAECPICGRTITVINIKRKTMSKRGMDNNGRVFYKECEPAWYDIWSCPYCHYSNHYSEFFRMTPFKKEIIGRILDEQHNPALMNAVHLKTPFDQLFIKYIQAIHINMASNANDYALIGNLWKNLYWLFDEAEDGTMSAYCREKGTYYLSKALEEGAISDSYSVQNTALALADMYIKAGKREMALKMCNIAVEGDDGQMKTIAHRLTDRL